MSQMKEHNKTPEKELKKKKKKKETSNPSAAEFKTLVIRLLNELRGRVEELSENFRLLAKMEA